MHPCQLIYQHSDKPVYGETEGVCRITGSKGKGLRFDKWVKPTFTDHAFLVPGNIISNEALFCFDEANEFLAKKAGKDKPQRFRNYTHLVASGTWHVLTKADKKKIFELITSQPCELVVIAESGQKHILFKHRPGSWQLEDFNMPADLPGLTRLHAIMMQLLTLKFSQEHIKTGNYKFFDTTSIQQWKQAEDVLKQHRGSAIFDLAAALMYTQNPIA